jgi:hypothetical protein
MSKQSNQKSNDQRSNVKNPNNPEHQKANDNRSVQLNEQKVEKKN